MYINNILSKEYNINIKFINNIIELIDEGNTIPFIARYRKELTNSIDDQILRELYDRLVYLRNLEDKKEQIINTLKTLDILNNELENEIKEASTLTALEDIYRPYKPKKRTRATIAKEKGIEPLAIIIYNQESNIDLIECAKEYINEEKEIDNVEQVLSYCNDIIAEWISDNATFRSFIRKSTVQNGLIISKRKKDSEDDTYEMYFDYTEPIKSILGHRVLAINRGEKDNILSIKLDVPSDIIIQYLNKNIIKTTNTEIIAFINNAIDDSYKRLIAPSIEREIRNELTEKAEEASIKVFQKNLSQLLMTPPIKDKVVLALDPGYRNGCKFAILDSFGSVLHTGVVYPTAPKNDVEQAAKTLVPLIKKSKVDIIAIGNGTASRETEKFVVDMIKENNFNILYIIVNESGASIYSASKLGAEEFPDYDVALRSAVSIGRRLQDSMSELVKIDPKNIGVGQYQHDMNQKKLNESLSTVVEDCVNKVGVELNTASSKLLSYVSGVSESIANNIILYREENSGFNKINELLKVKKLGPKTYTQCAGFFRIRDSINPLDNTGVHPESYKITEKLLKEYNFTLKDISNDNLGDFKKIVNSKDFTEKYEIGLPTLNDIIKELEKPGRDVRDTVMAPILKSDILDVKDLKEGMILKGTIRNVIDFGAFVDIGLHDDGLVHISELSNSYVKHPLDVVNVGDIVDVKVISIDIKKNRIGLSIKQAK